MYLTQSEMEIMQAYWTAEKEMSLAELIEASPNRCWKDRSPRGDRFRDKAFFYHKQSYKKRPS